MNGSKMIKVMDVLLIWYLQGLGEEFKPTRDTLMSTEDVLEEKTVINQIQGIEHAGVQTAENASWVNQQAKPKGPRCYACQGHRHIAVKCLNQQKEDNEQSSSTNSQSRGGWSSCGGCGSG